MSASEAKKIAVVVRGGWWGHQPVESTERFIPFLESNNYEVKIFDSPAPYADKELMQKTDLIMQCNTMNTITDEEFAGLNEAITNGTGMAGWHGGIADSYRNNSDYLHLIGGQFACHPGKHPDECVKDMADNYVPYSVEISELGKTHEITEGIEDFDLVTEQYWVLYDQYINVLATTTLPVLPWRQWDRPIVSPAVWTRHWGKGRIFVATPGHIPEVLDNSNVKKIVERGLLWASR